MKKLVYILAAISLVVAGCGKKGGSNNNNNGYCNTGNYGYGPYTNGYAGGVNTRYQLRGNTCIDVSTNRPVAQNLCYGANGYNPALNNGINPYNPALNNGYNPNCNSVNPYAYNGYNNGQVTNPYLYNTNPYNGANYNFASGYSSGICSQFNTPYTVNYPVFFPGTGQTLCVEYSIYSSFTSTYGTPLPISNFSSYYPSYAGYTGAYMGCTPGYNVPYGCNCGSLGISFGAQVGGAYAGLNAGVCY